MTDHDFWMVPVIAPWFVVVFWFGCWVGSCIGGKDETDDS